MNDLNAMGAARPASAPVQQQPQPQSQRQQRDDFADAIARDANASAQGKDAPASGVAKTAGGMATAGAGTQAAASMRGPVASTQALEASVTAQLLQRETVVQPVGDIETTRDARIFGVHLLAGRYLSELALVDPARAVSRASDTAEATGEVTVTLVEGEQGIVLPMSWKESLPSPSLSGASTVLTEKTEASSADESAPTSPHDASLIGSAAQWLERLLRYARQPDGSSVAWVRDFRLDDTQAGAVVAAVLHDAAKQGVTLQRIMLNGRTAWSSSQNQTGESA